MHLRTVVLGHSGPGVTCENGFSFALNRWWCSLLLRNAEDGVLSRPKRKKTKSDIGRSLALIEQHA